MLVAAVALGWPRRAVDPAAAADPSPTADPTGPATDLGTSWPAGRGGTGPAVRRLVHAEHARRRPTRTVTVTIAQDGTWLVAVPGGALGGTADVAIAGTPAGLYQCALGRPGRRQLLVWVAAPGAQGDLPPATIRACSTCSPTGCRLLADRQQALAVNPATTLPGRRGGSCFSVEPNSAALAPPVDAGIYCFDADGMLTAATLGIGTCVLAGAPGAAPATVTMPGPVVTRPAAAAWRRRRPPPSPTPSARRPGARPDRVIGSQIAGAGLRAPILA